METQGTNQPNSEKLAVETREPIFSPQFDIWEDDEQLIFYGDLPGVQANDLDVQFENHKLSVYGSVARPDTDQPFDQREYEVGDFRRSFTIDVPVNADAITAELKHGQLILKLPKSEDVKPRRIEVRTE